MNFLKKNSKICKSIIVVGVNRGGTSLITSSLNSINIHLGDQINSPTFEDIELAEYLRNKDWTSFRLKVISYEKTHDIFAWKLPDSVSHLKKINSIFNNPFYIFIYRDVLSIASTQIKVHDRQLISAMQLSLNKYKKILNFIENFKPNHINISYEKSILNPYIYAKNLLDFIGMEPTKKRIKDIVSVVEPSSEKYNKWLAGSINNKKLNQINHKGIIGELSAQFVRGWVINLSNHKPVNVIIYLNDKFTDERICNLDRPQLIKKGLSKSGKHGFNYKFKKPLNIGDKVSVKIKNEGVHLNNSPFIFQGS